MNGIVAEIKKVSRDRIPNEWLYNYSFDTLDIFKKFINWLSGEFILYQQEELEFDGLLVYFPNGHFKVLKTKGINSNVEFSILIRSKSNANGEKIDKKINAVLNHIKDLRRIRVVND